MSEPENLTVALTLAHQGIAVFPVHAGGPKVKQPMPFFAWKDRSTTDETTIRALWRQYPNAMPAVDVGKSGLLVVDADRHDPEHDGVEAWGGVMAAQGFDPNGMPVVATPNEGCHFIFREPGRRFGNGKGSLPKGIDVRGAGGFIVAPGAVLEDGRFYELSGDLASAPSVPDWLVEKLTKRGEARAATGVVITPRKVETDTGLDEIAELLAHIPPDVAYDEWVQALMAVHAATGGSSSGLSIADNWSSGGSKYKAGEVEKKWRSFKSGGVNGASLAALARQYGADLSTIRKAHMPEDHEAAEVGARAAAAMYRPGSKLVVHDDGTVTDESGEIVVDGTSTTGMLPTISTGGDWVSTSGLIGEIADWICDTARRPNRPLAVAAAIVTIGTICGRHLSTPTGCGTHLYVGCIGASTIGKDRPLKAIPRLFDAVGLPSLAATGKFKSDSAIEQILLKSPCCCAIVDEMGTNLFAKMSHGRASTHEQGIGAVLRELWSTSFDIFSGSARAGGENQTIRSPAFSIFGASTIDEFYTSLGKGVVDNGFLNRFTIVRAGPRAQPRNVDVDLVRTVPQSIVDGLSALIPTEGGNLQAGAAAYSPYSEPKFRKVPFASPEVETAFMAFEEDLLTKIDANPEIASFLGRTAEMTIRLSTIHAVSKLGPYAEVRFEDLDWGKSVATESAQTMVDDVRERIQENDYHGKYKRIEKILREGRKVTRRALGQRLNGTLTSREIDDILTSMESSGIIEQDKDHTGRRGRPASVITYLREEKKA